MHGMKASALLLAILGALLAACVAPSAESSYRPAGRKISRHSHPAAASNPYSMGGTSAQNPPIQPGETSTAYRERLARQEREALPEAQVMYQSTQTDFWGRSSQLGLYRSTGGVTEEVHIGDQRLPVVPGQPVPVYPPVYQGGYVPPGTRGVYDPYTGRVIPVRR